jgi:acetyl esterase/lipase
MINLINKRKVSITISLILSFVALSVSQSTIAQAFNPDFVHIANSYSVDPDITYLRASGVDLKLDVYRPSNTTRPNATLVNFHGGGWTGGSKEGVSLRFLPYLEMGWTVVNVQYRLADVAHAPAAVEDCRCALRWIYRNAEEYGFDLNKIVVTGYSAGGHLALTTGMLPESAGLDHQCPGDRRRTWSTGTTSTDELKVAAIINWYGITDVVDLLDTPPGPSGSYTDAWLGSNTNRRDIAERVSPLSYVRKGLPPILTIHGDSDPTVPYSQGVRLHDALEKAGVPNELVTVKGGAHGRFSNIEMVQIYNIVLKQFIINKGNEPS